MTDALGIEEKNNERKTTEEVRHEVEVAKLGGLEHWKSYFRVKR